MKLSKLLPKLSPSLIFLKVIFLNSGKGLIIK